MDDSERTIYEYLHSLRIGDVRYEPDGTVPPDFLVDGRIAVEARRLNEHEEVNGVYRGLEVTAKPLHAAVVKALSDSGPPVDSRSWFVHYTVRRPLPSWKEVERSLRAAVVEFRERATDPPREIRLGRFIRLRFSPASRSHPALLLLGSSSDHDAGGFVVAELTSNLQIYIPEKLHKVAPFRQRYERIFVAFILAIVLTGSLTSLWIRIATIVPVWVIVIELVFGQKTKTLATAPFGPARSQRDLALSGARSLGPLLLWGELVFFVALVVIGLSPLMPQDEVGWQKYGAVVLGLGGVAYVLYQLYLLRTSR
jgi:hypothetical protein